MRPIDADALNIRKYTRWFENVEDAHQVERMIREAPTIAPPSNDPLTMKEMREMDGEPVWVIQVNGELRPCWMLVDSEDESAANRLYSAMFEDYGTEWLAYRRKPEDNS